MNKRAVIAALRNTSNNVFEVLENWSTYPDDLRDHYSTELHHVLCSAIDVLEDEDFETDPFLFVDF